MNKLKLKRDELLMDIMRLAITITESKEFSVEVNLAGYVGWLKVNLHTQEAKNTICIIDYLRCFYYPQDDKKWHEQRYPLDYGKIIKELEKCKQTLNDLLIGKISIDTLLEANKHE
jgi:hypothetical protein